MRIDPSELTDRRRMGPSDVAYEPLRHPAGSYLVIASTSDWSDETSLSRALSRNFSAVRRVRTWRDSDELHFLGIGGKDLDRIVERIEGSGPKPTKVATLLGVEEGLQARLLTSSKDWIERKDLNGIQLEATRVYAPSWNDVDFVRRGLSDTELEVAKLAIRNGYYEKPRGCTMKDLADELGVSKSAVYHRLSSFERKMMERNRDLELSESLLSAKT